MKRVLSISLIVLTIAILGYVVYFRIVANERMIIWSLVPENSLLVYQSEQIVSDFPKLNGTLRIPDSQERVLPTVLIDTAIFDGVLPDVSGLISWHKTGKNEVSMVFYLDISNKSYNSSLQKYINGESNKPLVGRNYNGMILYEVGELTYTIVDGYFIGSNSAFLVEDVVRMLTDEASTGFAVEHAKALKAKMLQNDEGNLYINTRIAQKLVGTFTANPIDVNLGLSTFLDVELDGEKLSFNGFTLAGTQSLINQFENTTPKSNSFYNYVPNRTYSLLHYAGRKSAVYATVSNWIGGEIGLARYSNPQTKKQSSIIYLTTSDINEALKFFNNRAEASKLDTVFYEYHDELKITEIRTEELPMELLGSEFLGFESSYFTTYDGLIFLTSDVEMMHQVIGSIEEEHTWGKTLTKRDFLSSIQSESNISYIFDLSYSKNPFYNSLNEYWKEGLKQVPLVAGLDMGAIQVSNIDGNFYTTATLTFDIEKQSKRQNVRFGVNKTTYLELGALTKPFIVRNHRFPRSREVMVQDSIFNLYQISGTGEIVWKDSLGTELVSDITQVDYYKNKKLQYLFATDSAIHILDRNDQPLDRFPLRVNYEINFLSVIDYDHSKNYRLLTADTKGNLRMYDKCGVNLEGWKPRKTKGKLVAPARHIRVRGKDAIIIVHKESIEVVNRRGGAFKGFPLDLNTEISGDLHVEVGRDFDHTIFSVINKDGEFIQFNLSGEMVGKKQFYKPTRDTEFRIVDGVTKSDFVILRQNNFRVALLDYEEQILLEKDYLTTDERSIQYYDLGGQDEVFVVNDKTQGYSYIYDFNGKLINNSPINSSMSIGLLKKSQENKTLIYSSFEDQITIYSY